jgi:tetratricopeptide (TPR) repeat protein
VESDEIKIVKRRLILRDSIAFATLLLGIGVLFAVTLFLFRSFTARRVVLAQYWSSAGAHDLQAGKPSDAVTALRTALLYAPGTRDYELLLAQALGEAGCPGCQDESYNYYMSLWEAVPGDGPINLALARLAAKRNERSGAINFYRAAIYGTWEGDGVNRRANARLELARYLIATHDPAAARLELVIAAGNAPDDFDRDMTTANLLQQTDDPVDAWIYYRRAVADRPDDPAALDAAGRLAFRSGDFDDASHLLERAGTEADKTHTAASSVADRIAQDHILAEKAEHILDLVPSPKLSAREQVERALAVRTIAKKRFDECSAQSPAEQPLPVSLAALDARWLGPEGTLTSAALRSDPSPQDAIMQLVFDTETETANLCGPPTGDDALLLTLSRSPHNLLAAAERPAQSLVPLD